MEVLFAGGIFVSLLFFAFFVICLVAFFQGLILTFKANVLLGILCLFLGVPYVFIGLIYWIFQYDIPAELVKLLKN